MGLFARGSVWCALILLIRSKSWLILLFKNPTCSKNGSPLFIFGIRVGPRTDFRVLGSSPYNYIRLLPYSSVDDINHMTKISELWNVTYNDYYALVHPPNTQHDSRASSLAHLLRSNVLRCLIFPAAFLFEHASFFGIYESCTQERHSDSSGNGWSVFLQKNAKKQHTQDLPLRNIRGEIQNELNSMFNLVQH